MPAELPFTDPNPFSKIPGAHILHQHVIKHRTDLSFLKFLAKSFIQLVFHLKETFQVLVHRIGTAYNRGIGFIILFSKQDDLMNFIIDIKVFFLHLICMPGVFL